VIKRLSVLLSLAVLGVGIWLVSRGHEVDRVCKVNNVTSGGDQHFNHCMNLVSTYFLGYALCILGFLLFLMSIFIVRQDFRHVKLQGRKKDIKEQPADDSNPFRAVMQHTKEDNVVENHVEGKDGS